MTSSIEKSKFSSFLHNSFDLFIIPRVLNFPNFSYIVSLQQQTIQSATYTFGDCLSFWTIAAHLVCWILLMHLMLKGHYYRQQQQQFKCCSRQLVSDSSWSLEYKTKNKYFFTVEYHWLKYGLKIWPLQPQKFRNLRKEVIIIFLLF